MTTEDDIREAVFRHLQRRNSRFDHINRNDASLGVGCSINWFPEFGEEAVCLRQDSSGRA